MNNIISTYKKNRLCVTRAMPWSFIISRITGGIFTLLTPLFIYYFMFSNQVSSSFVKYAGTSDYVTYIVIGASLDVLAVSTLMNVGRTLIIEIREGTLEPFLLSPASRMGYFIGSFFEQITRSIFEFGIVLSLGLLLGARFSPDLIFHVLFILALSMFSFFSMAILLSSIMVYTRDTYITQNTIFIIMNFICGILFPVEYLPAAVRFIANIFPLTPTLKLFRSVVLNGETLMSNANNIIHIIILSIAFIAIGMIWFSKIQKKLVENILQ